MNDLLAATVESWPTLGGECFNREHPASGARVDPSGVGSGSLAQNPPAIEASAGWPRQTDSLCPGVWSRLGTRSFG